jgi:hypothetical protein
MSIFTDILYMLIHFDRLDRKEMLPLRQINIV